MTSLALLSAIRVTVTNARGPLGPASGPLGSGSVTAATVSNSTSEQALIANKLTTDRLIKNFGAPQGGTAAGVTYLLDPRQARFGVIATDATPQNDTMNYFAPVVSYLGHQPTATDVGLYSLVAGRNSYVVNPGGYGLAIGHDCLNVATAAGIGGAGSVVGNPNDVAGNLNTKSGYCSFGWMKNGQVLGQSAAGFGELIHADARGAFAATYQAYVETTAALGGVALGPYTTVSNGGQFSIGSLVTSAGANRMTIGSGVNPGTRFVNDIDGSLQLGAMVARGTIVCAAGTAADSYGGKFYSRAGFRSMFDNGATLNLEAGGFHHLLDNSASGGTTIARLTTRTAGAITPVVDLRNDFVRPVTDNAVSLGAASNRFSSAFLAQAPTITSDRTTKQNITDFSDELLDAWTDARWVQFQMRDAVRAKGDGARWHFGLVAQQVRDIFVEHGIDPASLGLVTHDEWAEEREPVMKKVKRTFVEDRLEDSSVLGPDGTPAQKMVQVEHEHDELETTGRTRVARKAGGLWGLRYDLCFAIEAAWQRRRGDRQDTVIADLVARVAKLEAA